MKHNAPSRDTVPPELNEFVEALALLLAANYLRWRAVEEQKPDEQPEGGDRAAG